MKETIITLDGTTWLVFLGAYRDDWKLRNHPFLSWADSFKKKLEIRANTDTPDCARRHASLEQKELILSALSVCSMPLTIDRLPIVVDMIVIMADTPPPQQAAPTPEKRLCRHL